MNKIETKYLLWYYEKQPKNKILNFIGNYLHSKLKKELERKNFKEAVKRGKEICNDIELCIKTGVNYF